jgi:hypothetical protein
MKNKLEQHIHLATALVTGTAPFLLDPTVAALLLATLSVGQAAISAHRDLKAGQSNPRIP